MRRSHIEKGSKIHQQSEDILGQVWIDCWNDISFRKLNVDLNFFCSSRSREHNIETRIFLWRLLYSPWSTWSRAILNFGGSEALQSACRALCTEFIDIFQDEVAHELARIPPFDIDHKAAQWEVPGNRTPLRLQSSQKEEAIHNNLRDLIRIGVVEKSSAVYCSYPVVVQKSPGQYFVCIDFRPLYNCTESASWPLPNIPAMFERIGARRSDIFGVMDLMSGYHQASITASAKILTAFICFSGMYQFTRLSFGLKRAPSYFQEMMATVVLAGLLYVTCEMYLDDCIVFGNEPDEFLQRLRDVIIRFREKNLFLKAKKCKFGVTRLEYIRRVISKEGLSMSAEKIKSVLDFPQLPPLGDFSVWQTTSGVLSQITPT